MSVRDLGRVFVTGADGFIGSHLTEKLLSQGFEVTALCLYNSQGSYGWLNETSRKAPSNLKLILGDVRDAHFMENALKEHQTVFHLASLIAIPYSYHAPESYFETNVRGALNTGLAAIKAGVSRFVHTSTSEVYGTAKIVPISETHPLQGQSPYSASKIGADMLVESFYRSFGLPVTTLRPFNTYGPRQSFRAVIPTIIGQALSGNKQIKLGALSPTRDLSFVYDTVEAFLSLARTQDERCLGETFNSGSGVEISIGALVDLIAGIIGTQIEVTTDEDRIRPKKSEVERLLADTSKLQSFTDWKSTVDLKQGIERTIEWFRKCGENSAAAQYRI